MNNKLRGRHVPFYKSSQLYGSVKYFTNLNMTAGAVYVSNSRAYIKQWEIDSNMTKKAHELANKNNLDLRNTVVVHAPLVGNLANTLENNTTHDRTVLSYVQDLHRMKQLNLKYFNFHPGSSEDQNLGIKKCAEGINKVMEATKDTMTVLLIETMAAKGNIIGRTFEQIRDIINQVKDVKRIGVTIDTCHIWDAGYDLKNLDKVLDNFDKVIGLKYLKAIHLNDSKNELGSNKDRHANIGKGFMGMDVFKSIVNSKRLNGIPLILETPYDDANNFDELKWELDLLNSL